MSTPESGTPTPTQKAIDQPHQMKERDVKAGLHRAADELAKELHKAAVCIWVRVRLAFM